MEQDNKKKPKPTEQGQPNGPGIKMSRNLISWVVLFGMAILLVTLLSNSIEAPTPISISKFDTLVRNKEIKTLVINEGGLIEGERTGLTEGDAPGATPKFSVIMPNEAIDGDFLDKMVLAVRDQGGEVVYERPNQFVLVLVNLLPWLQGITQH